MIINRNSEFLFGFQATMTNPNGDPDQENKPRMDYDTSTLLVSDARRKRDCRDFLKNKGYQIFVDTLADKKVPMDTMFEYVRDSWLGDKKRMEQLFAENQSLKQAWEEMLGRDENYKEAYLNKLEELKSSKKTKELATVNNLFLTEIIKRSLIDIRLFGSAMAVEGVTRTYTGPVQISWGYSLHPVELVRSSTITSIMNEDSSTFGKKYKVYYALVAHYGTMNKYSAKLTGMTEEDRDLFRHALVQGLMTNQTDSKQGQEPLFYLEIVYKPEYDVYLGDLRRFVDVKENKEDDASREVTIRSLNDLTVDFHGLNQVITDLKDKGYIEKVIGWIHPVAQEGRLLNIPAFDPVDLWEPIQRGE
ncbi:MAG: type I CRISPR-associated protein Cas7 [Firmicutes bacterium]|nr:type I CRISPR-associated protein Cas7 [Bacillota bacterium]